MYLDCTHEVHFISSHITLILICKRPLQEEILISRYTAEKTRRAPLKSESMTAKRRNPSADPPLLDGSQGFCSPDVHVRTHGLSVRNQSTPSRVLQCLRSPRCEMRRLQAAFRQRRRHSGSDRGIDTSVVGEAAIAWHHAAVVFGTWLWCIP